MFLLSSVWMFSLLSCQFFFTTAIGGDVSFSSVFFNAVNSFPTLLFNMASIPHFGGLESPLSHSVFIILNAYIFFVPWTTAFLVALRSFSDLNKLIKFERALLPSPHWYILQYSLDTIFLRHSKCFLFFTLLFLKPGNRTLDANTN